MFCRVQNRAVGLVPVIHHRGDIVYESTVTVEYIDETWSDTEVNGPSLLGERVCFVLEFSPSFGLILDGCSREKQYTFPLIMT